MLHVVSEVQDGVVAFMRMDPMKLAGKSAGVLEQTKQEPEAQLVPHAGPPAGESSRAARDKWTDAQNAAVVQYEAEQSHAMVALCEV